MADVNLAQALYLTLVTASKATKKPGVVEVNVTLTRDLINKRVTGNFVLPLEEVVDDTTGEITHKVMDSLEAPASVTPATTDSTANSTTP